MKYFIWAVIAIVSASIIAGFFVVGSPARERDRKFDERRSSDLQMLQSEIISYWQSKGELPRSLSDLSGSVFGMGMPNDPATKNPYGYGVIATTTFRVCADFALPSADFEGQQGPGETWNHPAGNTCFTRMIDPDFYPRYPVKGLPQ